MSDHDFLDDERRRLAYADRAETREQETIAERRAAHGFRELTPDERRENLVDNLADGTGRHSRKEMEEATNGYSVSFTSVPQLCAAYEYALETLKRLYLNVDPKQHAWQSEQDVMRDARALLLAAGKDVE